MTEVARVWSAVLPVIRVLDELHVDYLLAGSLAGSQLGVARSTQDADLVVDLRKANVFGFVHALESAYYVDEQQVKEAIDRRGHCNLVHLATGFKVDIFVPPGRGFDRQAMRRRQRREVAGLDQPIEIISAEDLVLAKLRWYREGGEVSERQWTDVVGVLRVQGSALDLEHLRRWGEELDLEDLVRLALREVGMAL